jgi:hypothetical protein
MFFSLKTTPLRLVFWTCCAGAFVFFVCPILYLEPNLVGFPLLTGALAGLAFTSAAAVKNYPKLALLGSLTLVVPVGLYMLLAFAISLFGVRP